LFGYYRGVAEALNVSGWRAKMLDASTKLIDENIRRDLGAVAQQN
jgi:hypothetical protein